MKTILNIGAGPSQTAGIQQAHAMGYRTVAVDGDPEAPGLEMADVGLIQDVKDKEGVLQIAQEYKVEAILSVASDICLKTAAAVTEILDLPGMPPERILPAVNKGVMRRMFTSSGVPGPRYSIIENRDFLREAMDDIGFPAVLKPVDSAGSRGVSFVESVDDLMVGYSNAVKWSPSGVTILEEFMPGPEISVEAFVANGKIHILTLSDKERTAPPSLLDTTLKFPSVQPGPEQKRVCDVAVLAIEALGIYDCPVHMEQIITPDGPKVVEMAARGPGFKVYTDIIPYVTGVNGIEAQIRLLFDKAPDLAARVPLKGACLKFFSSENDGVVKEIHNFDKVASDPEISDIEMYVKPGDKVKKLTCGQDRIGHLITFSETCERAVSLAEEAFHKIQITLL